MIIFTIKLLFNIFFSNCLILKEDYETLTALENIMSDNKKSNYFFSESINNEKRLELEELFANLEKLKFQFKIDENNFIIHYNLEIFINNSSYLELLLKNYFSKQHGINNYIIETIRSQIRQLVDYVNKNKKNFYIKNVKESKDVESIDNSNESLTYNKKLSLFIFIIMAVHANVAKNFPSDEPKLKNDSFKEMIKREFSKKHTFERSLDDLFAQLNISLC